MTGSEIVAVDNYDGLQVLWECDPPPFGAGFMFRVMDESWNDDYTVRTIRAWEPVEETA